MNLKQDKKYHRYARIKMFINKECAPLITAYPAIGLACTDFIKLFDDMEEPMINIEALSRWVTISKNQLKRECMESVWKLISAIKYHYFMAGDEVGENSVNYSRTALKRMSEGKFYLVCQMVMGLYDPVIYTPLGVVEDEMDKLKEKLAAYPTLMQKTENAKKKRKLSMAKFREVQKSIDKLLSARFDRLMEVAKEAFNTQYIIYTKQRPHGFVGRTTGKPFKKGILGPGSVDVIDKREFRNKLALIVSNKGKSMLAAGLSANVVTIQGTPLSIEPGNTRQRISQKLGSKGEFIIIQNVGKEEGSYEIWMKE